MVAAARYPVAVWKVSFLNSLKVGSRMGLVRFFQIRSASTMLFAGVDAVLSTAHATGSEEALRNFRVSRHYVF